MKVKKTTASDLSANVIAMFVTEHLTESDIAFRLGRTRQRINQILNKNKSAIPDYEQLKKINLQRAHNTRFKKYTDKKFCLKCHAPIERKMHDYLIKFCSPECRANYYMTPEERLELRRSRTRNYYRNIVRPKQIANGMKPRKLKDV